MDVVRTGVWQYRQQFRIGMMGYQSACQHKLFVVGFNMEKRIRKNHILRKILEKIDFDFIYNEIKDSYGENGNVYGGQQSRTFS